ncbi:MAG: DUF4115 domain-containing protein [Acidimicrobiia bacterium]
MIALLVVSVVATLWARRRSRDEGSSVDAQQRRLEALRAAVSATSTSADEATGVPLAAPGRTRARRRVSLPRARGPVLVGAFVVAGLAVLIVAVAVGSVNDGGRSPSDRQSSRPPRSSPTTGSTATTTTTVAPPTAVPSADGRTVSVALAAGPYVATLHARGTCWMQVRRADSSVVETTTLHAGDLHQVTQSGPVTVRLGNPGVVDFAINSQALTLPASKGSAIDVQLNPAT